MTLANASPATQVRVGPYESIAQVGESFTINVTLADVQNLYGIEVILRWDPSLLQVVSADVHLGVESHPDGVLHEDILIAKNETRNDVGRYWLAATSYNSTGDIPPPSFNGSGNIVRLTFNVTNVGSCELSLETELRGKPPPGGIAPPIDHTTIDGFFTTSGPVGGIWIPVNKLEVMAPYIGFVLTISIVLVAIVISVKRRKRKQ